MSTSELWHVKLSEGCVVEMTLDEIDTAFNAGRIRASTSVLAPGDFRWTTLGEAAGLDDEPEPPPYSVAPVAADVTPSPPLVDFEAPTELVAGGAPRRRSGFARALAVTALFGTLIAVGVAGGAYAAGPKEFEETVASVRDRITHRSASVSAPARAAAVAPPPPVQAAPPPPVVAKVEPAPQPTLTTAPSVGVDALPDAKAAAKGKKTAAPPKAKRK